VLDDERLKQGGRVFGRDDFDELPERIREIRARERRFYQKITDIDALPGRLESMLPVLALTLTLCHALAVPPPAPSPAGFRGLGPARAAQFLRDLHREHPRLEDRVEAVSRALLGTPYRLGPLGEGPSGRFDADPLASLEVLDCTTAVEEVMALALEPDLDRALGATLQRIRYLDGRIAYPWRNHFTELEWVPRNVAAGFLRDVTGEVAGPWTRRQSKRISRRAWYRGKGPGDLEGLPDLKGALRRTRLQELRALGDVLPDQEASLPYVPLERLPELLDRIPSGTVANLVHEDRPGKPTFVSHQVLLIRRDGSLLVRHAATDRGFVELPVRAFLAAYRHWPWPLLGLNLLAVQDPGRGPQAAAPPAP
jgi:hypothetical protein